jgi:putative hydrolase
MEFELALGLLRSAPIDVLAHPGGMYARHHGSFPETMMRALLRESIGRGIAVEISTSYLVDVTNFLRLCREENPYVSIGSNTHKLEQLGICRDQLIAMGIGQA